MSKTPEAQGLYDPRNEHDACGVGFVADVKGRKSHEIIQEGLEILLKLDHRGAVGSVLITETPSPSLLTGTSRHPNTVNPSSRQ